MTLDPLSEQRRIRHLRAGWSLLLLWLTLGMALEFMHGFKVRWYLDVTNETRRLMWTLAHAHGTLLALVHIAFAASLSAVAGEEPAWRRRASRLISWGALLLPLGFLLGGILVHGSDPWIGILLVPVGALCLLAGVALTARGVSART